MTLTQIPALFRGHLTKHVLKYIAAALGAGTVAGPVVSPAVVEQVRNIVADHPHPQYTTTADFSALNEKVNLLGESIVAQDLPDIDDLQQSQSPAHCPEDLVLSYCQGLREQE